MTDHAQCAVQSLRDAMLIAREAIWSGGDTVRAISAIDKALESSAAVAQDAVNVLVAGSNPASPASSDGGVESRHAGANHSDRPRREDNTAAGVAPGPSDAILALQDTVARTEKCRDGRPLAFSLHAESPLTVGHLRQLLALVESSPLPESNSHDSLIPGEVTSAGSQGPCSGMQGRLPRDANATDPLYDSRNPNHGHSGGLRDASPLPEGDRGQSWDMRLADRLQQLTDAGCESLTILQVLGLVAFVRDGEGSASHPSTERS